MVGFARARARVMVLVCMCVCVSCVVCAHVIHSDTSNGFPDQHSDCYLRSGRDSGAFHGFESHPRRKGVLLY